MIKLLVTDLDGTLLGSNGRVSTRNLACVLELAKTGIPTIAATARAPRSVLRISRSAGLGPLSICANGAITFDVEKEVVLRHETIPTDQAHTIVATIRDQQPTATLAGELLNEFFAEEGFFERPVPGLTYTPVKDFANHLSGGMTKIIARVPDANSETLRDDLLPLLLNYSDVTISGPDWIEFAPHGVSKATGIRHVCELLDISPDEVAAIGDQRNDLTMLSLVGFPFTVANAHPDVLKLAMGVVPHHNQSGFSKIINHIEKIIQKERDPADLHSRSLRIKL